MGVLGVGSIRCKNKLLYKIGNPRYLTRLKRFHRTVDKDSLLEAATMN